MGRPKADRNAETMSGDNVDTILSNMQSIKDRNTDRRRGQRSALPYNHHGWAEALRSRSSPHVEPSLTRLGGVVSGGSKVSSKHPGTSSGPVRQPVSLWFRFCSQRRQASHARRSHLFLLHADLEQV